MDGNNYLAGQNVDGIPGVSNIGDYRNVYVWISFARAGTRQNADRDPAGFLGALCGRFHDSTSPSANQDSSLAANQVTDFAGEVVYLRQA
jgi:hypothetical protein